MDELFDIENSWIYGKNKNWKSRTNEAVVGSLPVISGVTINNGISYYTTDSYSESECFSDSLTISTRGEYSGTVTYHEGKFLLANNILVLDMNKLSKNQKLFVGSLINKLGYGGYSGYPRKDTLKIDVIKLPTKAGNIDFDFMDSFIADLEAERIAELSAYLKVSGLKDYELSIEELKALRGYETIEWQEYTLSEVFEVMAYKKRFDANKVKLLEKKGYPYVVRKSSDNGIKGYIKEDTAYLNDGNTISFGQDTATSFYQKEPYFTGDKIKILKPKVKEFNKDNALFFVTSITRSFSKFSWGNSSYSVDIIQNQKLSLPTVNGNIDFRYIELLTKAVSKLIIKDVVKYVDNKIDVLKPIIQE